VSWFNEPVTKWDIFFVALVLIVILLPPKYDPAIWWKEYNERKRKERERQ
jgi:hypothetical protein